MITHEINVCLTDSGFNVGFKDRYVKFGEWLCSNLTLSTFEHINDALFPFGHANMESGVSPGSDDGNVLGVVILDVMKCITGNVFLDGDGSSIDLGFKLEELIIGCLGRKKSLM